MLCRLMESRNERLEYMRGLVELLTRQRERVCSCRNSVISPESVMFDLSCMRQAVVAGRSAIHGVRQKKSLVAGESYSQTGEGHELERKTHFWMRYSGIEIH